MGESANKFVRRAPRYDLTLEDDRIVRLQFDDENGRMCTTELVNLSATGAAFLIEQTAAPYRGERVKVEFTIPGGQKMAWWGAVARIEDYKRPSWMSEKALPNPMVQVGIRFFDLPTNYSNQITNALEKKFLDVAREQRRKQAFGILSFVSRKVLMTCFYAAAIAFTIWILWTLSRPSGNYDKDHGAPWGQRVFR